jgi:hypothetical protein
MKGVVASGVSVALFKNPVTPKGIMGYLITVSGVMLYSEVSQGQGQLVVWLLLFTAGTSAYVCNHPTYETRLRGSCRTPS